MSAATSSEEKRTKLKKLDVLGDDFHAVPDSEIKGIMSALQQIRVKAQSDGQKKSGQTISSEASELKSSHGELKASLGQDKRGTTIVCIMGNSFVVTGVDSNSTSGGKVVKSDMMKLINICDGVFAVHAGYVNVGEDMMKLINICDGVFAVHAGYVNVGEVILNMVREQCKVVPPLSLEEVVSWTVKKANWWNDLRK